MGSIPITRSKPNAQGVADAFFAPENSVFTDINHHQRSQSITRRIHQLGVSVGVSAGACGGIETTTRSVTMKLTGIKVSEAKPSDRERKLSGAARVDYSL